MTRRDQQILLTTLEFLTTVLRGECIAQSRIAAFEKSRIGGNVIVLNDAAKKRRRGSRAIGCRRGAEEALVKD
jgi:hypothetical protein